ncbi:translocation and assembly module TamB [Altererythrobacter atlanticus]|uniref:Translocation and assembly module TamB C-terminal domain-containing protein n=1 Tax=Croceibacterium atlanticum TaxID=1267766 RepID=A0A0F7KT72_9SPHN|nr:translocation/assembly module TamB domain-containing protein [Croceibacterium atlanticum]AKH42417.1 hypothetical protein WYH_01376 [Croceibacterium atlanticum]MBB5731194.1 translocation and assembly module TamB [Croceibacterium atlanticum]
MSETDLPMDETAPEEEREEEKRRSLPVRVLRWIGTGLFGIVLLLALVIGWLHTGWGRQFIVDQISSYSPASGLSVEVGHIEGSVLWSASFYDVEFRDAEGKLFLEVPEIDLNWRPYKFLFSGLDVRHVVIRDGTLHSSPELIPGDPDAPTLPNFDIRVDRLLIDNLRIDEGLVGEARTIDFRAKADIRDGLVYLDADGDLGGGDRLELLAHAEPDGDRFDLDLDYRAPAGGLLSSLTGIAEDTRLRLKGDGSWQRWDGAFVARQNGDNLAAFKLWNRAGYYKLAGQVWPGSYVEGMTRRALGEAVSLAAGGTLENSILDGAFALRGDGVRADARGSVDLGNNAFDEFGIRLALLDPALFGDDLVLEDARIEATLDGPFQELTVPHKLSVGMLDAGGTIFRQLTQQGTLRRDGETFVLPLDLAVGRIVMGNETIDPRLVDGRARGTLRLTGDQLSSPDLSLAFRGLQARLGLQADLGRGVYAVNGPVRARNFVLDGIGSLDADADIRFRLGNGPWRLQADVDGRMPRVDNGTLTTIAGEDIRFSGKVSLGSQLPVAFENTTIDGSKLHLELDGVMADDRTTLTGEGEHTEYGPFTLEASLEEDGPHAELVMASPLPAAGLRDVRIAVAPAEQGYAIDTEGQSTLGPFAGKLQFLTPDEGPSRIAVEEFRVSRSNLTGDIILAEGGADGTLQLTGGGLDGTIGLAPRDGGQGLDLDLRMRDANFTGTTPLTIRRGRIEASGAFGDGAMDLTADINAAGVGYGQIFLGRLAARGQMSDGEGSFDAAINGRRGSQFAMKLTGTIAPDRITLAADGNYSGRDITMPLRAVLTRTADDGWQLQPTQLGYGNGFALAQGRFGGTEPMQGKLSLSAMPLSLIDAAGAELGLGGTVSGVIDIGQSGDLPVGEARLMIDGLTRSGLVLSSRPINLAMVGKLTPTELQARSVLSENGDTRGRLQARISGMPANGALFDRLSAGNLLGQLRFEGPADALWRLSRLELLDMTGTLQLAADLRGSIADPQVRGSLAGDALRIQSALTGTDVRNVRARGRFSGSRLQLTSFAGEAPNGGRVSGSGFVDLANMGPGQGPQIDLRIAARDAELVDLPGMGATVTGPLRIVSNGMGGTIAGRLRVNEARWRLGGEEAAADLPNIQTREINLPTDIAPPRAVGAPWRFLIDANAPGGIKVDGMGLDSFWSADIRLRGTTDDPRIGGEARIVPRQGFYSFAGVRFDITRGRIDFDESVPIDPRIDLVAETDVNNLSVSVSVQGYATRPEISFNSTPSLPEEELLAQLLFGGSITDLSATEAVQLGAAVASLRGGGGMDPINQLRSAIGLDRLRIVPSDPALDRGTAVALGKNFGRRFYVEIITDGRSYNATEVEFRLTSWISLLASINSLGRGSTSIEYSRDY